MAMIAIDQQDAKENTWKNIVPKAARPQRKDEDPDQTGPGDKLGDRKKKSGKEVEKLRLANAAKRS